MFLLEWNTAEFVAVHLIQNINSNSSITGDARISKKLKITNIKIRQRLAEDE